MTPLVNGNKKGRHQSFELTFDGGSIIQRVNMDIGRKREEERERERVS